MNEKGTSKSEILYYVYVVLGQKLSTVAKLVQILLEANALEYSILVMVTSSKRGEYKGNYHLSISHPLIDRQ